MLAMACEAETLNRADGMACEAETLNRADGILDLEPYACAET